MLKHVRVLMRYCGSKPDVALSPWRIRFITHDTPDLMGAAFNSAWVIVKPPQLEPHSRQEKQLRLDLARCITDLVANGVTDAEELRRQAVEQMLLAQRPAG